jgi:hypothetical protein
MILNFSLYSFGDTLYTVGYCSVFAVAIRSALTLRSIDPVLYSAICLHKLYVLKEILGSMRLRAFLRVG